MNLIVQECFCWIWPQQYVFENARFAIEDVQKSNEAIITQITSPAIITEDDVRNALKTVNTEENLNELERNKKILTGLLAIEQACQSLTFKAVEEPVEIPKHYNH